MYVCACMYCKCICILTLLSLLSLLSFYVLYNNSTSRKTAHETVQMAAREIPCDQIRGYITLRYVMLHNVL